MAFTLLLIGLVYTQNGPPTVAILDFEGRGISQLEAATLTDRFNSEIDNTNTVRLVQRSLMEEILAEQGLQQSGCTTDECAVEVGALLGVQFMISGSIGKIGDTYTIDTKLVSVETGATERSESVTYIGKVDGLITEIEILAWKMMGLEAPMVLLEKKRMGTQAFLAQQAAGKTKFGAFMRSTLFPGLGQFYSGKKLWGFLWMTSEVAVAGLIFVNYSAYQTAYDDYNLYQSKYEKETSTSLIADYKARAQTSHADMEAANAIMETLIYAGAGVWVANMLHSVIVGPKKRDQAQSPTIIKLVYDPYLQQPQLRLSIALD